MASVTLNRAQLDAVLRGPAGPVVSDLLRRGRLVRAEAVRRCPVDTGRLRSSIAVSVRVDGGIPYVVVGTNVEYARYVHDGTGVYGPTGNPIRSSTPNGVLVFKGRDGSTVFARSVRGVPARPFLREALEAAVRTPPA